jgi:ParB family chromosome partitioning protein
MVPRDFAINSDCKISTTFLSQQEILMTREVTNVRLEDIRENPVALRAVDRESEDYLGLCDSIRSIGVLNAISLRRKTEDVDGTEVTFYELCDGLHRYSAAKDAGLVEVPAIIVDLDDAAVQEAQVMANVHRIVTRPVEYTRQLNRIFAANPTMTVADLAGRLCKSSSWVSQRLGLLKLGDDVAKIVDDGKISVSNAVALAKLPQDEQSNFVDHAMTMGAEEFVPTIQKRVKEIRDAKKQGRAAEAPVFSPVAKLQKLGELKSELETPTIGPQLVKTNKVKTAEAGFALCLAWVLHLDPASIEVQKAAAEAKAAALADAKKKRAADRAAKKAAEAQKEAAEAAAALAN